MSELSHFMRQMTAAAPIATHACNCIGVQPGHRMCPCMERAQSPLDWPPKVGGAIPAQQHGCICPAGAEKTCEGLGCPRRNPFNPLSPVSFNPQRQEAGK